MKTHEREEKKKEKKCSSTANKTIFFNTYLLKFK